MPASDVPDANLGPVGGFRAACQPEHLIVFALNVGDGDCAIVLLPEIAGRRPAVIIDVAKLASGEISQHPGVVGRH